MFKPWGRNRFREDSEEADDVDIFSRSEETLKRARLQQEAQRAQKRQKQLSKREQTSKPSHELNATKANTNPNHNEVNGDENSVESIEGSASARRPINPSATAPPVRQSPRKTKAAIIEIDDSDDDPETTRKAARSKASQPTTETLPAKPASSAQVVADEDDSDAEIRALAARSRARKAAAAAEQARLLQTSNSSLTEIPSTAESTLNISPIPHTTTVNPNSNTSTTPTASQSQDTTPPSSSTDPVVSIFLHSRIPNTNPLIVNRRISQPLRAVRLAFCKTNQFPPDLETSVFLTWRGRRVFDISSCSSLCVDVDAHTGTIYIKGDRHRRAINARRSADANPEDSPFDADDDSAKLEMEVVTQAIFEADRLALQAKLSGAAPTASSQPTAAAASTTTTTTERRIKIILRGPGYDDYKLTVKPTTLFAQIVAAFRKQRGVPDGKETFLMFDGERLVESDRVDATDIDDLDFVDVHVK